MRRHDRLAYRWLFIFLTTLIIAGCRQTTETPTPADSAAAIVSPATPADTEADPSEATSEPETAADTTPVATLRQATPTAAAATSTPLPTTALALTASSVYRPATLAQALHDGDYALAIQQWEADQLSLSGHGSLALDMAHAYLAEDRPYDAIALLVELIEASDDTQVLAPTLGLLGATYADIGEWQASLDAYQRHLDLTQVAAPQVRWRMAQACQAMNDPQGALEALDATNLDELSTSRRAEVLEEMAQLYRKTEDSDSALDAYQEILSFARQSNYRALVQHYRAQTLVEDDRLDEALAQWQEIIAQAPESYAAVLALDALDQHQAADLDDLARGRILYHARRYEPAQKALQAFIYAHTDDRLAEAYYFLGLVYAANEQFGAAFDAFDMVIREYADSEWVAQAWLAKAEAEEDYGGDPSGLYYEFARLYPQHESAAEALWFGAQYLEKEQAWAQAGRYYGLVEDDFAASDHAPEAAFRRGLMLYAGGRYAEALQQWQNAPPEGLSVEDQARWFGWAGLAAHKSGQYAVEYWQQASTVGPTTYYGLRAQARIDMASSLPPNQASLGFADLDVSQRQWREIENWVGGWYTETSDAPDLEHDTLAQQAIMLEQLGWHAEAMEAVRALYDGHLNEPHVLQEIARFCLAQEWYSPMILAANRLRWLGQRAEAPEAPDVLWQLSFPVVYDRLILAYAEQYDLDPLLMLALMRQESRFDGRATSYAGAQGLAQVMPDTGQWIAERLGQSDYRTAWLERPSVSVSYGAWFMRTLLDLYDEDTIAMLVAYNAGPGNFSRWTNDTAITDHDLFVETLPVQQPQDYVEWITIQYHVYQRLYAIP